MSVHLGRPDLWLKLPLGERHKRDWDPWKEGTANWEKRKRYRAGKKGYQGDRGPVSWGNKQASSTCIPTGASVEEGIIFCKGGGGGTGKRGGGSKASEAV